VLREVTHWHLHGAPTELHNMEATEHTLYETYTDFASMYKTLKTVNSLAKTEFVVQHAQQALQAHGREVQRVQNNEIQQRGCSKPD